MKLIHTGKNSKSVKQIVQWLVGLLTILLPTISGSLQCSALCYTYTHQWMLKWDSFNVGFWPRPQIPRNDTGCTKYLSPESWRVGWTTRQAPWRLYSVLPAEATPRLQPSGGGAGWTGWEGRPSLESVVHVSLLPLSTVLSHEWVGSILRKAERELS